MKKEEFIRIRKKLGRTQLEMSELINVSKKTIESYEQGLRQIPDNMSRIIYYVLFKLHMNKLNEKELCWNKNNCPMQIRKKCIAWMAKDGFFCWFLNMKTCLLKRLSNEENIESCFECDFFKDNLNKILNS
jgi:DNA-binding XRE family transcriptional regulator